MKTKTKPKVKAKTAKEVKLRPANEIVKLATEVDVLLNMAGYRPRAYCRSRLRRIIKLATEQNASTGRRETSKPHTAGGARVRK